MMSEVFCAHSVRDEDKVITKIFRERRVSMETRRVLLNVAILVIATCLAGVSYAEPMGTAFTYQGSLTDANSPAEGLYDFEFELFDQDAGGNQYGNTVTKDEVDVIDGYFMVLLDFVNDANVFDGDARWLQIGVRQGPLEDPNTYSALSPRQELTPAPYAIYAENAGGDGDWTISGNDMYSTVSGNVGIGKTNPTTTLDVNGEITAAGGSSVNWNTAYGWNDHSGAGYLTSESDPVFSGSAAAGITSPDINNWNTAYGWGDHSGAGYLTSESDPVFSSSAAAGITSPDITNWNTAYGWGDHSLAGYLTSETDPQVGANTTNYVPKWDGSALITGTIYDNGNVGVGEASPAAKLDVSGDINASSVYKIGGNTVLSVAGSGNTLVGIEAGAVNTGNYNTFSGNYAGRSNTTGYYNTFSGYGAGYYNTKGNYNTFSGYGAGYSNTTGSGNVFLGYQAGYNEIASNKLYIDNSSTGTPLIYGDFATNRLGINRVPATNAFEVEGNASKTSSGDWLANSDARIKTDVQTVTGALETLDKVRLVSFKYTDDYQAKHPSIDERSYLNVIAQEFAEVFPDYVKSSKEKLPNGEEILQVDAYPLTVYSAAAVQELHTIVKAKEAEIATQNVEIAALKKHNDQMEARLATMEAAISKLISSEQGGQL
jgi:hypothetical protein